MQKSKRKIRKLQEGETPFKIEYIFEKREYWTTINAKDKEEAEYLFFNEFYSEKSKITSIELGY